MPLSRSNTPAAGPQNFIRRLRRSWNKSFLFYIKQKSGRAGGQAARPVFVFFARDAVPITPNAAPEAAEQTMLQLPFEKENGMEELAFAQQ